MLFKTISREQAIKTYRFEPEGPDLGKYNPKLQGERQPCYVRIKDEKVFNTSDSPKRKEPS